MRAFTLALLIGSVLTLGACTMPGAPENATRAETDTGEPAAPGEADSAAGDPAAPSATPDRATPSDSAPPVGAPMQAPPMSDPLPPEPLPAASGPAPGVVDRSCRTDADCAVKDVGSCCGAMPACVNTNAKPDPAAVKAQCERQGMSSVCGFKEITACSCVAGTCQDGAGVADR